MFCLLVELKKVKDAKNIVAIQIGVIKKKINWVAQKSGAYKHPLSTT